MVGHRAYDLAVHLECDPDVRRYNMQVPVQDLVRLGETRVRKHAPAAASLDSSNKLSIHTFSRQGTPSDESEAETPARDAFDVTRDVWAMWCRERGYAHVEWTPSVLRPPTRLLENRKRLLRFVSRLGGSPLIALSNAMLRELRLVDSMSVAELVDGLELGSANDAFTAIAALILDDKIASSIDSKDFDFSTVLSVHHDIES